MKIYELSQQIRQIMKEKPTPDERELVRRFIRLVSRNRKVKYYQIPQSKEAEIGADFLWIIFTNSGASAFLVQAKKLKDNQTAISRKDAGYTSNAGDRQVNILLNQSHATGIPAIYLLFSNRIQSVPCGHPRPETQEGVFFDSAANIHSLFQEGKKKASQHLPISCLFACFSKKCYYFDHHIACKVCSDCKGKECLLRASLDNECPSPFELLLKQQFGIAAASVPICDELLPLVFADSILKNNPEYVLRCLSGKFTDILNLPGKVIITDYLNRHGYNYLQTVMGPGFVADQKRIYKAKDILPILKEKKKAYGLFQKIGLFGSCARNDAGPLSDIDIALVYKKGAFKSYDSLLKLGVFIKDIVGTFQKNVDFLDYRAAQDNENSEDFIADINKDMLWV